MANTDLGGNFLGNVDVNYPATLVPTNPSSAVKLNFNSIPELRAYLTAQQPATYTSAFLDVMTKLDMTFAARKFAGITYQ